MKDALSHYKTEIDGFLIELEEFRNDGAGVKSFGLTMDSYTSLSGKNYSKSGPAFMKALKDWGLHYYARPAESFFMHEAYKEAHLAGCRGVVVENMS